MPPPASIRPPGPRSWIPGRVSYAFSRDVLGYMTRVHQEFGDVVSFNSVRGRFFIFFHPDQVRDVLVTREHCFIKGPALRQAKDMLGEGLLTSEGSFHQRQRRLAQPAFHAQRVNSYAPMMTHFAQRMSDGWRDGQVVDIHEQMMRLTLSIVAKTLFDADVEAEVSEIGAAMDTTVRMFSRAMVPFGRWLNYLPLPSNFRFWRARRLLWEKIGQFIRDRRASGVDRGDLLSMLLRATDQESGGSGMNDIQLRDECVTLFTAGHETTANALTFTWYLLAQHPQIESALRDEVLRAVGERLPTPQDLANLPLTRAVLAESMRLYPPAWAIGREAVEDCVVGGYDVPRGSIVLVSQWVTHRDERWWPAATTFDPGRWMTPSDRARYAYFPFGGGARSCIGESFAWLEAMLLIATLVQKWHMELLDPPPLALQPTITLRPRRGIRMKLIAH